jgi:hypothetical protein
MAKPSEGALNFSSALGALQRAAILQWQLHP